MHFRIFCAKFSIKYAKKARCKSEYVENLKNKINFSYDGANFADIQPQTGYGHFYGELARYNGSPVAIGGCYNWNKKVEILQSDSWREVAEYPTRYFLN